VIIATKQLNKNLLATHQNSNHRHQRTAKTQLKNPSQIFSQQHKKQVTATNLFTGGKRKEIYGWVFKAILKRERERDGLEIYGC
jgi:hypothetical protein